VVDEAVLRALVVVPVEAELVRPAVDEEVLDVRVRDDDLLVADLEGVELADDVLLGGVLVPEVVLDASRGRGAEEPRCLVDVAEDQAPEIAVEGLAAELRREEVVVRREVGEVDFEKARLELDVAEKEVGPFTDVGEDDALPERQAREVTDALEEELPVEGL